MRAARPFSVWVEKDKNAAAPLFENITYAIAKEKRRWNKIYSIQRSLRRRLTKFSKKSVIKVNLKIISREIKEITCFRLGGGGGM